jgi:membrane associated rhomboid family serine protease
LWLTQLKFWQMITFPFVHNSVFSLLFDAIVIFFFGGSLERAWGSARFVAFFFMCGIVAGLTVLGLTFLGMPPGFFIGMTGHFVGLGVAFGALNPYARIYIYFVLPVEGRWLGVISIFLELFVNYGSYGSPINAVIAIGVSALFAWTFTRGFSFGPRGGGGGAGFKERFERWRQRQRMRAWQRKVSQIDKPEDLFKDK